jgi:RNA polymerase sigma-70 factor, ECF subfamily
VHELREEWDDAALLSASSNGDRRAFAAFYRRHLAAVVALLLAETRDRELAAELTAEVFGAALLAAGRYRPENPSALPWLAGIARHKARDSARRGRAEGRARRRLGIPREPVEDSDLERVEELASQAGDLLGLLEQLPARQRLAVRARVIEERSYSEIAAATGSSEAAVRQQVSRALSWLRKHGKLEEQ